MNERIRKIDLQLKTLYLLDTDKIAAQIRNELPHTHSKIGSHPFDIIFDAVCKAASPYLDFLSVNGDSYTPFFGNNHGGNDKIISLYSQFVDLTIKNNCIFNSFIYKIYCGQENVTLPVSYKNRDFKYYFNDNALPLPDQTPQFYNSRKQSLFKDENTFDYKLFCSILGKPLKDNPLYAPRYLLPAAYFLLVHTSSHQYFAALNRYQNNYQNTRNADAIIKQYNSIISTHNSHMTDLESSSRLLKKAKLEQLMYGTQLHSLYGFDFIHNMNELTRQIYGISSSGNKELFKPVNNILDLNMIAALESICRQLSRLPVYFNRNIFFKYACTFYVHRGVNMEYFSHQPQNLMTRITDAPREDKQPLLFFDLAQRYLDILTQSTIPLIYALWDVVTEKLKNAFDNTLDTYENYLTKYFDAVSFDYSSFHDDIIGELINNHMTNTIFRRNRPVPFRLNNDLLSDIIKKNEPEKTFIHLPELAPESPSERRTAVEYLKKFHASFDAAVSRTPYFFMDNSHLSDYSPFDNFIDNLIADRTNEKGPLTSADSFLFEHKVSMQNYIINTKPS